MTRSAARGKPMGAGRRVPLQIKGPLPKLLECVTLHTLHTLKR